MLEESILIWLAVSPEKISKNILEIIENPLNDICVSTVSLWEIAIKLSIKKLDLQGLEIADLVQICEEQDMNIVQLPVSAVKQYRTIPIKENHRDPPVRQSVNRALHFRRLCISFARHKACAI